MRKRKLLLPHRTRTLREVIKHVRRRWFGPGAIEIGDIIKALAKEGTRVEVQLVSARTLAGPIVMAGDIVIVDDRRHGLVVFPVGAVASVMREPRKR